MTAAPKFWVRFWGVRGTVPCPGPETVRYGGNTACVEIMCGENRLIFDAGTGLRVLGAHLNHQKDLRAQLFLTHTHIDHINGFPFFRPAYRADNCFELWAGHMGGREGALQEVLSGLMRPPIFPVPLDIMHACIAFHDFAAGATLEPLPGVTMRTAALNHPNGATGYRIEFGGRSICYVTDTEHRDGELDRTIVELIRGSQIVIYDATYTEDEYPSFKGWGHSTWEEGVRLCRAAGAARLVAFHHDPDHTDADLDRIAAKLEQALPGSKVAAEGLILEP
jgi:phosphoribosyl 1,2-cyclic phosphodiesterase